MAKIQARTTGNKVPELPPPMVPPTARDGGSEVLGSGNLDQIREILFGAQSRTADKRIARLEEELPKRVAEIREELKRGLATIEAYARGEIDSLNERVRIEARDRGRADDELKQKLDETSKGLHKEVADLDERSATAQREFRQQLLDQAKRFDEDIQRRTEDLAAALARAVEELRAEKADRKVVASILHEVAMRLTDEFALPLPDDVKS